jgi:hypothetical protein
MDIQLNQYFNVLYSLINCFLTPALAIFQLYRSVLRISCWLCTYRQCKMAIRLVCQTISSHIIRQAIVCSKWPSVWYTRLLAPTLFVRSLFVSYIVAFYVFHAGYVRIDNVMYCCNTGLYLDNKLIIYVIHVEIVIDNIVRYVHTNIKCSQIFTNAYNY